jgi:hypothetical protein
MTPTPNPKPVQGSLFEEHYLLRTLGTIGRVPDVALTELVANAWDAGASKIQITIPTQRQHRLIIEDDGAGMTLKQFKQRWMTLGYDRVKHQGKDVEFPPDRPGLRRTAYGHNGIGRHGMLCFADDYLVETRVAGAGHRVTVTTTAGADPFVMAKDEAFSESGHGTRLIVVVTRNLPDVERVREVLAAHFSYDPQFTVLVNGVSVPLHKLAGLIERRTLKITESISAEAYCLESVEPGRTALQHGIAFWVGGRLVGEPSWTLDGKLLLDGRLRLAKRLTIVVQLSSLFDEVEPDWSGFRPSDIVHRLYEVVGEYVAEVTARLMAGRIDEVKDEALDANRGEIRGLEPLARAEVEEFAKDLATSEPTISPETLSVAVQSVIKLEETRSGKALLVKLASLQPGDIAGLNRLLDEWTVRDALTVLDEIGKRIRIIEALEKLASDESVDELATLHPLVTQARWLFGPEYDSPMYTSNITIRHAVEKLFGVSAPPASFENAKRRPDLVFRPNSTISTVATEDAMGSLVTLGRVLVIELKRGGSVISRVEMNQANGYVEDLLAPGLLDGSPTVTAFVVGHAVDPKAQSRKVGERGMIEPVSFDRLIRTANLRLFRLRDQIAERHEKTGAELEAQLEQQNLFGNH